jgi:uncharacterized protein (TIRG00374 family)
VTKILLNACKCLLGVAVLAFVGWRYWYPTPDGGPGLADTFAKPIHLAPLLLALLIFVPGLLITFMRWYILVRAQQLPFKVSDAFRLGLIGFFLNSVLPGSVGGDIVKAAFLMREQGRRTVAIATILVDRVIGLLGLIWLVALLGNCFWALGSTAVTENKKLQFIILSASSIALGSLAFWYLLGILPARRADKFAQRLEHIRKVGHPAAEFWRAIWMYRLQARAVLETLLLSVLGHLCFVLAFYCAALVFGDADQAANIPSLTQHFLLIPLGLAIQALPLSPGGLGIGEASFAWLYGLVGYPQANGFVASFNYRVLGWAVGAVGYLAYLWLPALRRAKDEEKDLVGARAG